MTTQNPTPTNWARFSDYEIVDGAVRPVDGAAIEFYNPWFAYRVGNGGPHIELLRLLRQIQRPTLWPGTSGFRREDEERILDWCRQWGLLGLWHQQTLEVTFETSTQMGQPWAPEMGPAIVQRGYTSANGTWEEYTEGYRFGAMALSGIWDPSIEKMISSDMSVQPWRRKTKRIYREGITKSTYEVDYSYTPEPSHPLTEPFWRAYKERVFDMWEAMTEIASAIEGDAPELLLGCAKPVMKPSNDATWAELWACPSLISVLGAMKLTDMRGGRVIVYCKSKKCGLPFVGSSKADYCPPLPGYEYSRCREAEKKRRLREREKAS